MLRRTGRIVSCLIAASLLVAACGDDDVETSATSDTTMTTADTTTTTTTTTASGDLPGERIEIFPYEGAQLGVVSVEADDTLNVRTGPGVDFDVAFELEPLADGVIATGHNRSLDEAGIWAEITVDDESGWANVAFLSHLGAVEDITSEVAPTPEDRPRADTMLELGEMIAEERSPEGPPPADIVVVDGPTVGEVGEITVDVIGFGDDAVAGERLHIVAEEGPGGESFILRTVERTLLCIRGVTDEGICT